MVKRLCLMLALLLLIGSAAGCQALTSAAQTAAASPGDAETEPAAAETPQAEETPPVIMMEEVTTECEECKDRNGDEPTATVDPHIVQMPQNSEEDIAELFAYVNPSLPKTCTPKSSRKRACMWAIPSIS